MIVKLNERVDRMEKTVDIRIGESANASFNFLNYLGQEWGLPAVLIQCISKWGRFDTS